VDTKVGAVRNLCRRPLHVTIGSRKMRAHPTIPAAAMLMPWRAVARTKYQRIDTDFKAALFDKALGRFKTELGG
jgi:hypothetical protein